MKKLFAVPSGLLLVTVFLIAGCSTTNNARLASGDVVTTQSSVSAKNDDTFGRGDLIILRASVEAIDLKQRLVTVIGPTGHRLELKVDESARNLPQLKVGDTVKIEYLESVEVRVLKTGETGTPPTETAALVTAQPGQKPGGVAANQITVTATIEAINKNKPSVTLRGQQGKVIEVKVRHPEYLDRVKVGDNIEITYTEALALSVEKINK